MVLKMSTKANTPLRLTGIKRREWAGQREPPGPLSTVHCFIGLTCFLSRLLSGGWERNVEPIEIQSKRKDNPGWKEKATGLPTTL